jgi:serine/threonine protein phosphatase PrpC
MDPPVFGKESAASATEPALRDCGDSSDAGWRMEGASTDWCTLRAAAIAGVRHRLAGQPGEDCFAWYQDGDHLAWAVADGLGSIDSSAGAARRAAVAAVRTAVDRAGPEEPVGLAEVLDRAVEAAEEAAAEGEGATTLVLAVVDRLGRAEVARVGDSSAFVVWPDGSWRELFDPPEGDRVGSETAALPHHGLGGDVPLLSITDHVSTVLEPGSVLALASDGVADPWRDGPTTVAPALAVALAKVPSALELARLVDFSRQGCHDDRSLACVWWRG